MGVTVLAVVLALASPDGQALGEAAQKAREQRNASGGSMKITGIEEAALFQEVPLTVELVNRYAKTRIAVAEWLWNHRDARERMHDQIRQLTRARNLTQVYAGVPELKSRIEFDGFTTESFLRVHVTIERARARRQERHPQGCEHGAPGGEHPVPGGERSGPSPRVRDALLVEPLAADGALRSSILTLSTPVDISQIIRADRNPAAWANAVVPVG